MTNADKPVAPRRPRARRRKAVSADDTVRITRPPEVPS